MALSYAVRGQTVDRWITTQNSYHEENVRRVHYLSMEYIFGKSLRHTIVNLGLEGDAARTTEELGFGLYDLCDIEDDFELGNGGKGRLAAGIQEAMASQGLPAIGYGLRYDYALFRQRIVDGRQAEAPYDWAHKGHPWEIVRPQYGCTVPFEGHVRQEADGRAVWEPLDNIAAVPYDMPIVGYRRDTVNTLRLWSARASEQFLQDYRNHGDYARACDEKSRSGRITRLLIPDEDVRRATDLRIKQQYFFASASLQDIIRRYKTRNDDIEKLADKVVIHLNGSRGAIAVAELMRLLMDVEGLEWGKAWRIVRDVFVYTSHAVAAENLENWPVYLVEQALPRHIQIIYEINQRHLDSIAVTDDTQFIRDLSVVEEGEVKRIRMAYLAVLGSSTVNGVSAAQSRRLKTRIFATLATHVPTRFVNTTNGVAYRRWLLCANEPLAGLIDEAIGEGWRLDAGELEKLAPLASDGAFLQRLDDVKMKAKRRLAERLASICDVVIDPEALIDVQTTRIHPYKRQVLHVLGILRRYHRICSGEDDGVNRVHIFAGRAAPSDHLAKQILHLINVVAGAVNGDPRTHDRIKMVFIPDWSVTWGEFVLPAADVTEAIGAPNYEACGCSSLKAAFNGAVIIGSKTGVNREVAERVGDDNILLFGHDSEQIDALSDYAPGAVLGENADLKTVLNNLEDQLLPSRPGGDAIFPLIDSLRNNDPQLVLLDFREYITQHARIDQVYRDRRHWLAMSALTMAHMGYFSGDRAVLDYARDIWKLR
jgi:starch phosphorylase